MADRRSQIDLSHGQVGRITYLSPKNLKSQTGIFHTSRITYKAPYIKVIGSSAELYPASKTPVPEGSSNLWQERRTQRRWLLQAHPQAFMGNSALQEVLEENMNRFQKFEGEVSDKPLLEIGQMTSVYHASHPAGAPLLAAATGESGELLRLARVEESKWQWAHHRDVALSLSVIDPDDPEEEVIWASDGLPISQIKFATSITRYDATRWLLVQKQTSTTILQPAYHRVPVAQKEQDESYIQKRMSRIDPNLLVTLSHKQTGGNAHIDLAFNPGARGQPPQLAVMDECGYWTIWNVIGINSIVRNTTRLVQAKCGHIMEGFLDEIPTTPAFPAERHGLIFVGYAELDSFLDDPSQSPDGGVFATRSQHLLLWSRHKLEVVDLVSGMALPRLSVLSSTKYRPDWIIDVKASPVSQNHVLILTMRHLFWVDLFTREKDDEEAPPKPLVLVACPHMIDGEDLRMTTCRASDTPDQDVTMVVTYSPKQEQMHTYWFGYSSTGIPQWHRQILTLPREKDTLGLTAEIQSLAIHPSKLMPLGGTSRGPGTQYQRSGVLFYQCSILGKDLSIRYCICASVLDRSLDVVLPSNRTSRKMDHSRRWKKKRKHFLHHVDRIFVFPDGIDDLTFNSLVQQNRRRGGDPRTSPAQGPINFKLDILIRTIQETLLAHSTKRDVSPDLISAINNSIDDGVLSGRLPLTTWKEIEEDMPQSQQELEDDGAQHDILDLLLRDDGETVVTQLGRRLANASFESLNILSELNRSFSDLWIEPLEGKLSEEDEAAKRAWIAELARDAFLSTSGIMVQDVTLFGAIAEEEVAESSQRLPSSSIHIKSSQSSGVGIPSSPISTTSTDDADTAVRRLQLLAPTLRTDKMASSKPLGILSYWPRERGVGTEDYVSSVAIASDQQFDEARKRLKKIEDRRKSQAERYRLPPSMRQGASQSSRQRPEAVVAFPSSSQAVAQPVPATRIMSSQQRVPNSSQSQGMPGPPVAMSQPVPGLFGDRKKVKKPKRKSGFR